MPTNTLQASPITWRDSHAALIYKDGILDYDVHDAYLRALGYEYLALPCTCDGNDDDGHMPSCGWGKPAKSTSTVALRGNR